VAYLNKTYNNADRDNDLMVKQFIRTLNGIAFDYYAELESEFIDS